MIFNGPHIWVDQNVGQIWPFQAAWRLNTKLVDALVIPHFDYANVVLRDLSWYCAKRLRVLFNIAVQFILQLKHDWVVAIMKSCIRFL